VPEPSIGTIDIAEARAPDGFVKLDDVISLEELEEISRRYKRTAGFDPEILNTRPSLTVRQHWLGRSGR
jgi:5-methylphenazine-1-carboxylate 1-monooxygenase